MNSEYHLCSAIDWVRALREIQTIPPVRPIAATESKKKTTSIKSIIQDKLIVSSARDSTILFRRQSHVKKQIVFVIKLTIASLNTKNNLFLQFVQNKTNIVSTVFNRQKLKREIDQSENFRLLTPSLSTRCINKSHCSINSNNTKLKKNVVNTFSDHFIFLNSTSLKRSHE